MRVGQSSLVTFVSQFAGSIIGFLAIVFVSRELGPVVLGTYFLTLAIHGWVQTLSVSGVVTSIIKRMSEVDESGSEYLSAGGVMLGIISLGMVVVLFALGARIDAFVGEPVTPFLIVLTVVSTLYALVRAGLMGENRVHTSSLLTPVEESFTGVTQVLLALTGFGLVGILFGKVLGLAVVAVIGMILVSVRFTRPTREHVEDLLSFTKYSWLEGIQGKTYVYLDTVIIGAFAATQFVGFYQVAFNVATVLALFGTSISRTLFPALSSTEKRVDKEYVGKLFGDSIAFSGLLLIPGLVGSVLVGADVLRIYGPEFTVGHQVLVVLVVSQLAYTYMTQTITVLNAIDRASLAFRVNALFVVTNLVLNLVLVPTLGYMGAAIASALTAAASFVFGYRQVASRVPVTLPLRELLQQLSAALVMGVVIWLGLRVATPPALPGPPTAGTVVYVALGGMVYGLTLYSLSPRFRGVVRDNAPVGQQWL